MALPTETTGHTYGWSPNDFIQNFNCEGDNDRGGANKGANEAGLAMLEGDVVEIGASYRGAVVHTTTTTTPVLGVALSDAKLNEMVPIACGPIVKCECAETVTRGNWVGSDDGEEGLIKPVTPTGGGTLRGLLGIALQDGDDGDIIAVCMKGTGVTFVS